MWVRRTQERGWWQVASSDASGLVPSAASQRRQSTAPSGHSSTHCSPGMAWSLRQSGSAFGVGVEVQVVDEFKGGCAGRKAYALTLTLISRLEAKVLLRDNKDLRMGVLGGVGFFGVFGIHVQCSGSGVS